MRTCQAPNGMDFWQQLNRQSHAIFLFECICSWECTDPFYRLWDLVPDFGFADAEAVSPIFALLEPANCLMEVGLRSSVEFEAQYLMLSSLIGQSLILIDFQASVTLISIAIWFTYSNLDHYGKCTVGKTAMTGLTHVLCFNKVPS